MTAKNIRLADLAGLLTGICLGVLVLLLLAGCAGSPPWGAWSKAPTQQQLAAVRGQYPDRQQRPDTYIYFSNYQIYQHARGGEYVFWDGATWVTTSEPPQEVSAELLRDSPQVELRLANHPARTHAEVVKRYPRDWQSPDSFVAATQ